MNKEFSRRNRLRCEARNGFNHKLKSWSLSDWFTAVFGEIGEAANIAKKLNRIRDNIPGNKESYDSLRTKLENEIADAYIYLDLLCQSEGIDLSQAVEIAFTAKSKEIGYVESREDLLIGTKRDTTNVMPSNQGKRDKRRPHYNYIPLEFDNELASIFEEGRKPRPGIPEGYGDSWMKGGKDFLEDCLNHAFWHLKMYMRGDRSENHLAKVAWNVLCVRFHELKEYDFKS